jgi:hypothetical protein
MVASWLGAPADAAAVAILRVCPAGRAAEGCCRAEPPAVADAGAPAAGGEGDASADAGADCAADLGRVASARLAGAAGVACAALLGVAADDRGIEALGAVDCAAVNTPVSEAMQTPPATAIATGRRVGVRRIVRRYSRLSGCHAVVQPRLRRPATDRPTGSRTNGARTRRDSPSSRRTLSPAAPPPLRSVRAPCSAVATGDRRSFRTCRTVP